MCEMNVFVTAERKQTVRALTNTNSSFKSVITCIQNISIECLKSRFRASVKGVKA
jgi:hypothetical protein